MKLFIHLFLHYNCDFCWRIQEKNLVPTILDICWSLYSFIFFLCGSYLAHCFVIAVKQWDRIRDFVKKSMFFCILTFANAIWTDYLFQHWRRPDTKLATRKLFITICSGDLDFPMTFDFVRSSLTMPWPLTFQRS